MSPAQTIHLNAGPINPQAVLSGTPDRQLATASGKQLQLVQFAGPIQEEWLAQLEQAGLQIVDYVPDNAYLVYGSAAGTTSLRTRSKGLRWSGAYLPKDKINPRARPTRAKSPLSKGVPFWFAVQLIRDDGVNSATVGLLSDLTTEPFRRDRIFRHYRNLIVRLDPEVLEAVAARPDVISIAPYRTPKRLDERQGIISAGLLAGAAPAGPGYLGWLGSNGFTQAQFTNSGLVVDICDSGIDNGTNTPNHFGLYISGNTGLASRVVYSRLEGMPSDGTWTLAGCDGHGTINAHIVGGYNDRSSGFPHQDTLGYRYGLGLAPYVRLGASVIFDNGDPTNDYTNPDFADMVSRAYRDGARISSDSWGTDVYGEYDQDSQAYDALVRDAQPTNAAVPSAGNQEMIFVFPAGNAGEEGLFTLDSPGTAKNVITVGASENVHSHAITNGGASTTGSDGCDWTDLDANSAQDIAPFSSRGPCLDGRSKPDLVAPGTHITGGVAQQARTMAGNGTALTCFNNNAAGICGLVDNTGTNFVNYFPTNQQWYTTSSGTSHSTPAVSGGAALTWQYFINRGWGVPSPAMVKAYLVNATAYMTGQDSGDDLWSPAQGMGRMDLGRAFDGVARVLRDQRTQDVITASGQVRTLTGMPADTNKPVRITLTWTDAPGATFANAYKNDLNLQVSADGWNYRGNVFHGAFSTNGGAADEVNNQESVFLPAGTTGRMAVVVSGANINSDGIPNIGPGLDQDFALVAYNFTEMPLPAIVEAGAGIVTESCTNGAIDPSELVTVNFALRNAGTVNTTNVVATLLATGGVASPSGSKSYGALLTNGVVATQSFSFVAVAGCGDTLTATLALNDNGQDLGRVLFDFRLGLTTNSTQIQTNANSITLPAVGSATPYPSSITVSNLTGTISKVTATLRGFGHSYPNDLDIILVSPDGQKACLLSAVQTTNPVSGATITFDDEAATPLTNQFIVSGTYLPTGLMTNNMNAPAPGLPYASTLGAFNGGNPNGIWKLYAQDSFAGDSGTIAQGWSLTVTATRPLCCGSLQPQILAIFKTNTTAMATRIQSEVGKPYRLDYTRNLATNPVMWTPAVSNFGTGGLLSLVDSNLALDVKRYYRVVTFP